VTDLKEAVESYLAALTAEEWRALVCRVRPPDELVTTSRTEHALFYRER
jgi:hypothetical protein